MIAALQNQQPSQQQPEPEPEPEQQPANGKKSFFKKQTMTTKTTIIKEEKHM